MSRKTSESIPQIYSKEIILDSDSNILTITGDGVSGSVGEFSTLTASNLNAPVLSAATGAFDIIGIGTTTPLAKLHVNGTNANSETIILQTTSSVGKNVIRFKSSPNTNQGYIGYGSSTNDQLVVSNESGGQPITFYTSGTAGRTEKLRITSEGNVGIGTASPSAGLTVGNNLGIVSTGTRHNYTIKTVTLQGNPSEGVYAGYLLLGKKHPSPGGATIVDASYAIGKIYVRRGTSGTGHRVDIYEIASSVGYNGETFQVNLFTPAGTQASFFSRLVYCTYGGVVYHAIEITQTGGYPSTEVTFEGVAVDAPLILTDASFVSSVTAFGTIGIVNASNVGIGTAAPSQKLHVSGGTILVDGGGDLQIRPTTPGGNGIIRFMDTAGTNRSNLYFAGTDLFRISDLTADRFKIDSAGNVGIGTTSPSTFAGGGLTLGTNASGKSIILNSSADGSNGVLQLVDLNGNNSLQIFAGSTQSNIFSYSTRPIILSTNSLERMRIDGAGNIGIGTTTPSSSLTVKGTGTGVVDIGQWTSSNTYGAIYLNGDTSTGLNYNILSSPGDKDLYINRPTGQSIRFRMNNSEQMVIGTNGNVGINTGTPGSAQVKTEIVKGTPITSRSTANTVLMVSDNSTSQTYIEVANTSSGGAGVLFGRGSSTGNYGLINYNNSTDKMDFYTAGSLWAHVNNSGKLTLVGNSLDVSGSDSGEILNSYNTSASSVKQFYLKHNLGNIDLGNIRAGTITISTGSVAIGGGTYITPTNTLDVNGTIRVRTLIAVGTKVVGLDANNVFAATTSDARLKKNVKTIENALQKVQNLRGVEFNWDFSRDPDVLVNPEDLKKDQIGLIAQEVENIIPQVVVNNGIKDYKTINYAELVSVLIEAVKELKSQVDSLKTEIQVLKSGSV